VTLENKLVCLSVWQIAALVTASEIRDETQTHGIALDQIYPLLKADNG
jgi:hypothetical protein